MKSTGMKRWALVLLLGLVLALPVACRSQAAGTSGTATRAPASTPTPCDKCGKDRPRPTPTRVHGTAVGQEAPELSLPDLEGNTVRLSDYRGRVVLLNFWATWCGPCRVEVPELVSVHESYKERGFTVLAVNLGESRDRVAAFSAQFQMDFPVLLDPAGQTTRLYPTRGIPTSFLLDGEGVVRRVVVGAMDEEMILGLIEPILGT